MENPNNFLTTLPDLIEIQKTSFCWFIYHGLSEELERFSSIIDFTESTEVKLFGNEYKLKKAKYNEFESKQHDSTYSARIFLPLEIRDIKTNDTFEKRIVYIGNLPLMTNQATFIINGCARVIISQIIRSPGIYYKKLKKKIGYEATLISNRGSWLKFEIIVNKKIDPYTNKTLEKYLDLILRVDKSTIISAGPLLKQMGLTTNQIFDSLKYSNYLSPTLRSDFETSDDSDLSPVFISRIFNNNYYNLGKIGRRKLNQRLNLNISENIENITYLDIVTIMDNLIGFYLEGGIEDDIDHLQNRRVRSVGELLQTQFRVGFNRLERNIKEKMVTVDTFSLKATNLVNPKPVISTINEFFCSSQLSQFMDQTNPLAALTHKRRISSLGPGGLNRDRISFAVRDIHPSQYGRICPIETPEGPNAGLISSLTTCSRVNNFGFIETPFWPVIKGEIIKTNSPVYLTADVEDNFKISPADIEIDKHNKICKNSITVRYQQDFITVPKIEIDYIAISTVQIVSAAAALIPFFEHDDANRALMGSNMQRQSVPLLIPQKPIVGTGLENQVAVDSGMTITAFRSGMVVYVSSQKIIIKELLGNIYTYNLQKYNRSNQDTCINQRPLVWVGENVESGQIIADGPATNCGELALGQNIIVAYMPWQGYNFEDAILINERLIYDDVFTSIHIEKFDLQTRQTKVGDEEITRDIPNMNSATLANLDNSGIVYKGAYVKSGDILVGKITPKGEYDQIPEGKLLRAIFGEKAKDVRDTSLKVPNGQQGRVLDIKEFHRINGDELPLGTTSLIRVFLAQIRKIQVGDKIAGRHGNKGIISRVLPRQDMPYLPDGTPIDVILNPLGVPSRMNVGQLYECLLGFAGYKLNRRFKILPFDEMYGRDSSRILINKKLREASIKKNQAWVFNPYTPGKIILNDGRTGEPFENPITVGKAYMLKLIHLVDEKIHARSTGPYSLVTQQPLGGKSQNGGQRFGEMEVWALEAFGAAYILQELLTVKSDDMQGRNNTLNAIVKGRAIPKSGVPESFKVLMRELQAIGLDISTYKTNECEADTSYYKEVNLMEVYNPNSKRFSPVSNFKNTEF
tara:strand:- start:13585 stop:16842 length:3258 start_codon:yes stop_codon:yes gene_type:complete